MRIFAPLTLGSWAVSAGLAALGEPFMKSGIIPLYWRFVLWAVMLGLAIVLAFVICEGIKLVTHEARTLARDLKVAVIFAVIYGPLFWLFLHVFANSGGDPNLPLWLTTLYIFVVMEAILYLRRLLEVGDEPIQTAPRLTRRIKGLKAAEIARISGRDHYVDVHLTNGARRSVLMRFSDALAELNGIDGVRVHRSHWVAKRAVVGVERDGRRIYVVTADHTKVPVSRGFRENAIAAGLI